MHFNNIITYCSREAPLSSGAPTVAATFVVEDIFAEVINYVILYSDG
jgi:hypothetical protein